MTRHSFLLVTGLVCLLAVLGCQREGASNHPYQARSTRSQDLLAMEGAAGQEPADKKAQAKDAPLERKVIFTADFQLTVVDFAKAEQNLQRMIQTVQGFAAKADVSGAAGGSQVGTWRIRVPVLRFSEFRDEVKKLGDLVRYTSDAHDVSEEYYDLVNRIKSKEDELTALRKLFDKGSGKIDDVLAVQREVSRAQTELEQLKGRQRVLENLTDLTTITVHLQERGTYQPTEPPTFGTTVAGTFSGSVSALLGLGKVVVIAAVALAPWVPLLAVLGISVWVVVRRKVRPAAATAVATEVPKTP